MAMDLKQREELGAQRLKDADELKKAGGSKANKNVVLPKYSLDERLSIQREVNPPPPSIFIGLGFNNVPEDKKKHYRRYYPDELENVKEVIPKLPFTEIKVVRGQQRGVSKGFFSFFSKPEKDNTGQISTIKTVGKFKGIIKVYNKDEDDNNKAQRKARYELIVKLIRDIYQKKKSEVMAYDFSLIESMEGRNKFNEMMNEIGLSHLHLGRFLNEWNSEDNINKLMLQKSKAIIRLYVIEGFNFSQRDIGSFSDPYLVITCGKKVYNERDKY